MTTDRAEPQQPSETEREIETILATIDGSWHIAAVKLRGYIADLKTAASPAPDPAQEAAPVVWNDELRAEFSKWRERHFPEYGDSAYEIALGDAWIAARGFDETGLEAIKELGNMDYYWDWNKSRWRPASPPAAPVVEDHEYACLRAVYEATRAYLRYEAEPDRIWLEVRINLDNAIDDVKRGDGGYDYAAPVANGTEGQRRVVCAACKLEDGTFVTGARHMDGIMRAMKGRIGKKWMHDPAAQGFIDQRGVYMTRREAWKVAEAAGQILYRCGGDTIDGGHLFSENLY